MWIPLENVWMLDNNASENNGGCGCRTQTLVLLSPQSHLSVSQDGEKQEHADIGAVDTLIVCGQGAVSTTPYHGTGTRDHHNEQATKSDQTPRARDR